MVSSSVIRARPHDLAAEVVSPADLMAACETKWSLGFALDAITADPSEATTDLTYLLSTEAGARAALRVHVPSADLCVPTVVPLWPQADWLERRIRDLFGVSPVGHPHAGRLVRHSHWPRGFYPLAHDAVVPSDWSHATVDTMQLTNVRGRGIHEIPVGPIHAGIIEPGHFRFFADGERIVAMEPRLFYVHRGVEGLMRGSTFESGVSLAEVVSGDTAVGHAWAYCEAIESALGIEVDSDSQAARAFLLEAERIACHIGNLGGMLNDIAFGWGHAQCQGLREELLRAYSEAFGHRLLRGLVVLGGVDRRLDGAQAVLGSVEEAVAVAVPMLEGIAARAAVIARTQATGRISRETAIEHNAMGVSARASGVARDRRFSAGGPYDGFEPVVARGGDVEARFLVRLAEIRHSAALMSELAESAARATAIDSPARTARSSGEGIGAAEGWRGECLHWVRVEDGRVRAWYPRDPSALNWPLLPLAVAGEVVPDFPLVNMSFNLSYAGNDL
jgi:Ni,Fe-hydrogenase III large subunit/Ni,Fe-hydrogenase III component G